MKPLEEQPSAKGGVPTLLWSLDDALRYLPMAALYDGQQYMLERFRNVLFTPESYGHMTDLPLGKGSAPSVLAMGLSKSYGGLPPLPGVMPELDSVVHDPAVPESHGPMEGKLLRERRVHAGRAEDRAWRGQELPGGPYRKPFRGGNGQW